ncbi:MAG: CshA/CshB family fibrillar adhesin-related protein, partial [Flavobacterium sp.]
AQTDIIPAGAFTTAAYATGGSSQHKDKVLWLTWGAQSKTDTYGKHNVDIKNGSASYAKIDLGGGRYLKISAVISNLQDYRNLGSNWRPDWQWTNSSNGVLNSYGPGNYSGDSMDDMYNIGGIGSSNKLISGLRNTINSGEVRFKITAKATIEDQPVRLSGMVLGDAESLASGERFYAEGSGEWTIVDLRKNISAGNYKVKKTNSGSNQKLEFISGNDNNTGAVAFMTFNEDAYKGNSYEVEFDVYLKGGGLTAIALGLIPPSLDMGDAPESYGNAMHMLEAYVPTEDNVPINREVNLNTKNYTEGTLKAGTNNYLGSTAADADIQPMFSKDAKGDDDTGTAGPNEEDAWPESLRRFSHKLFYKKGDKIEADITYS